MNPDALPPLSLWRPSPPVSRRLTVLQIAARVAAVYGVTVKEIIDRDRTGKVWLARQATYCACRAAGYSLHQIGYRLGNRDRTTILKALQRKERREAA